MSLLTISELVQITERNTQCNPTDKLDVERNCCVGSNGACLLRAP